MSDEDFNKLLKDKKFMDSLAWQTSWRMFVLTLPFVVVTAALGSMIAKIVIWKLSK